MLVLSRKAGEKIHIGELITVTICRIGPNAVRVGIEAPLGMNIVREEIVVELGQSATHKSTEIEKA